MRLKRGEKCGRCGTRLERMADATTFCLRCWRANKEMRMAKWEAIYKCRLCGRRWVENDTDDYDLAIDIIKNIIAATPSMLSIVAHIFCPDGSIGIGDFQGMQRSSKKEPGA